MNEGSPFSFSYPVCCSVVDKLVNFAVNGAEPTGDITGYIMTKTIVAHLIRQNDVLNIVAHDL